LRERFRDEQIEVDGEAELARLRMSFNERLLATVLGRLMQN
jgi:hypothetical protein